MDNIESPPAEPVKSLEFYYKDGNVVFEVSNVLYRLHKSVLTTRLDLFGGMFLLPNGKSQHNPTDGLDDSHPIRIERGVAVREDFEALLKHIYGVWDAPPYPVPFLLSVLKMSTKWGLPDGRERAIYYLEQPDVEFPNLLKFHTSIKYNIPQWVRPTFDILVSTDWEMGHILMLSGYDLCPNIIDLVVKTRDIIGREQRRLATIPPPVEHHSECRGRARRERCESAWVSTWVLNIGRQVVHVDPLFRLESYKSADAIRALEVPGMSEGCLRLTKAKVLEGDAFDYIYKVCTAALAQIGM